MPGNRARGFTYHVVGGNSSIEHLMNSEGARWRGMEFADLVIFQGGSDVHPSYYGEEPHPRAGPFDTRRDRMEAAVFGALDKSQWKVGICRGAQFLNVLNGGKTWQHVEGHTSPHEICFYEESGHAKHYMVSSTHHQMMLTRGTDAQIWGYANQTRIREFSTGKAFEMSKDHWRDPEIVYYPKTKSLCFQPHPEYSIPKSTSEVFFRALNRAVEA